MSEHEHAWEYEATPSGHLKECSCGLRSLECFDGSNIELAVDATPAAQRVAEFVAHFTSESAWLAVGTPTLSARDLAAVAGSVLNARPERVVKAEALREAAAHIKNLYATPATAGDRPQHPPRPRRLRRGA